jgi:hypothetical protein
MKSLKGFLPSLYSEYLLNSGITSPRGEPTEAQLIPADGPDGEGDLRGPGGEGRGPYERGLGETFGFPGDARKMRERSKMKLWREYFMIHGRNMTLLRYPPFQRLLQVGLPSRLRGELWEVMSGSICEFPKLLVPNLSSQLTLRPPLCKPQDVPALIV